MPAYFSAETFRFLKQLARNNNREWFHANKPRYEQHLRQPFLQLIADLAEPLQSISPHFRADPKPVGGSMFRIHRDTRFSADKTPYKTWSGARFPHARGREHPAPVFYLHIAPGNSFVGGGLWHPDPPTQRRIREFIVDNPEAWKSATRSPAFRRSHSLGGDTLVRPPRGFEPDHPLIDDLKRKDFVASRPLDDTTVLGPRLASAVTTGFRGVAPLNDYLCAALDLDF